MCPITASSSTSRLISLLFCVSLALCPLATSAQAPELNGVVYAGVQPGTTGSVLVDGKNLQGATVLVSGSGIGIESVQPNATHDYAEIKLKVASDAPIGPREIRMATPNGVSGPARIWIDPFPQLHAGESNYDLSHAQVIDKTPVSLNGRIAQNPGRHCYQIQAKAGETWVFDCNAARIRSQLDAVLELRDDTAHLLKMAQSTWESDPRLIYRFEKAGRYFLTIRDTQFQGGVNYDYLLTIGRIPVITRYQPHGGSGSFTLQTEGINCGKASLPAQVPPGITQGEFWLVPETDKGMALPIPLIADTIPVLTVSESSSAIPVSTMPVHLDGEFGRNPVQQFTLHSSSTDHLVFDLLGRRIGSRIDGSIRVLDAGGKELMGNDDAVGKDARLEFTAPAEGDYTIEVRNVEGITGPDCFYRLSIRRVNTDFQLRLAIDSLNVGAGGTVTAQVEAERSGGFAGDIALSADALPLGVRFSGGIIPVGQKSTEVTWTSAPDMLPGATVIHLLGSAEIRGKKVQREAVARRQYLPRAIDPGMFTDDSYRRPLYDLDMLPLGVSSQKPAFTLEMSAASLVLAPGQKLEVVVRAVRSPGVNAEIKLELRDLPGKVTATVPPVPANQTESRILLTAAPDAPVSLRNVILTGRIDSAVVSAPALQVTVRK